MSFVAPSSQPTFAAACSAEGAARVPPAPPPPPPPSPASRPPACPPLSPNNADGGGGAGAGRAAPGAASGGHGPSGDWAVGCPRLLLGAVGGRGRRGAGTPPSSGACPGRGVFRRARSMRAHQAAWRGEVCWAAPLSGGAACPPCAAPQAAGRMPRPMRPCSLSVLRRWRWCRRWVPPTGRTCRCWGQCRGPTSCRRAAPPAGQACGAGAGAPCTAPAAVQLFCGLVVHAPQAPGAALPPRPACSCSLCGCRPWARCGGCTPHLLTWRRWASI